MTYVRPRLLAPNNTKTPKHPNPEWGSSKNIAGVEWAHI